MGIKYLTQFGFPVWLNYGLPDIKNGVTTIFLYRNGFESFYLFVFTFKLCDYKEIAKGLVLKGFRNRPQLWLKESWKVDLCKAMEAANVSKHNYLFKTTQLR